jgi:hypothetical protein
LTGSSGARGALERFFRVAVIDHPKVRSGQLVFMWRGRGKHIVSLVAKPSAMAGWFCEKADLC